MEKHGWELRVEMTGVGEMEEIGRKADKEGERVQAMTRANQMMMKREGSSNSAKPEADEVGEAKWRISGRRRVVEGEESLKTLLLLLLFYYR